MMRSRVPHKRYPFLCTRWTYLERRQTMSQVMIIEDSQALRKIMEVLLRREEIDTESYVDGYTALRALQSPNHPVPAVVLLDLGLPPAKNLPAIDGYAFAKLLRSQ